MEFPPLIEELDEDNSDKHPLTVYAKTKWEAECGLKKLNGRCLFPLFVFRPSTVLA